jgi:hypothetical protein
VKARILLFACATPWLLQPAAYAQQSVSKAPRSVQLELTSEVAATTDEGYPALLLVKLRNVGNDPVDLPWSGTSCLPDGGVSIQWIWTSSDNSSGASTGGACFADFGQTTLSERVRLEWIHLRPGESITTSENLRSRYRNSRPGTITYWIQFTPRLTARELAELRQEGYVVPEETLKTAAESFVTQ